MGQLYDMARVYEQDLKREIITQLGGLHLSVFEEEDPACPAHSVALLFDVPVRVHRGKSHGELILRLKRAMPSPSVEQHVAALVNTWVSSTLSLEHKTDMQAWKSENSVCLCDTQRKVIKQEMRTDWRLAFQGRWMPLAEQEPAS